MKFHIQYTVPYCTMKRHAHSLCMWYCAYQTAPPSPRPFSECGHSKQWGLVHTRAHHNAALYPSVYYEGEDKRLVTYHAALMRSRKAGDGTFRREGRLQESKRDVGYFRRRHPLQTTMCGIPWTPSDSNRHLPYSF